MAEYIKREALKKELEENTPYNWSDEDYEQGEVNGYKYAVSIVEAQDAADVAEIVRCKDCKYFTDEGDGLSYCKYHTDNAGYCDDACWVAENDFCSYGARMDGEGE